MQTCYYEGSYEETVQSYIDYYHKRATRCKWFYYILNTFKIGLVVSIPVLQSIDMTKNCAWIVALVSALILFVESILELTRLLEKWTLSRDTCNRLLSIQRRYKFHSSQEVTDEETRYMEAVEEIVGDEARKWYAGNKKNLPQISSTKSCKTSDYKTKMPVPVDTGSGIL